MNTNQPIQFDGKDVQIKCVNCSTYFKPDDRPVGSLFCSNRCKQDFNYSEAPKLLTKTT
jgi:hypothetical protein